MSLKIESDKTEVETGWANTLLRLCPPPLVGAANSGGAAGVGVVGGRGRRGGIWSLSLQRRSATERHEAPPEKLRQRLKARPLPLRLFSFSHPLQAHLWSDLASFKSI